MGNLTELKRPVIWFVTLILAASVSTLVATCYLGVGPFTRTRTRLVVSTTTSLYDTGLLDIIEDRFEAKYPIDIYFISAGSGIAIKYAQRGDADMVLVHAPPEERTFLQSGYGVCRKIIAYNFFTIVGPETDPAMIKGLGTTEALKRVAQAGRRGEAFWVSRGDGSGTHIKEKELWAASGLNWSSLRNEGWFVDAGASMGKALQIANEKMAYTLADMGTYLKYYADKLISLAVIVEAGKELLNVYSAITVNPTYNPEANFDAAVVFTKFLISEEGQEVIGGFGQGTYPRKLFYPAAELLRENTNATLVGWIKEEAYIEGEECPKQYQNGHKELYG